MIKNRRILFIENNPISYNLNDLKNFRIFIFVEFKRNILLNEMVEFIFQYI
jgi:hypothetical protein